MKKIFCYITLLLATASYYSCKKDLNALPPQAKVEGNVVVDQKSADVALNGAYARFANVGISLSTNSTTWSYSHEIYPSTLAGYIVYAFGVGATDPFLNNVTPAQSTVLWNPNFSILNAANGAIDGVTALADSKFTGSRKAEILGEARFLRAYAHFNLLKYYSVWNNLNSPHGVLLRKGSLKLSDASQSRSSVKESYDFILSDLDFSIANAADVRPNYYANKTAAKALKMRVLMQRGQLTDYATIITLANEIMANSNYVLEPSLRDLMQVKGLTSKEVILGITPFAGQVGKRANFEFVQSGTYLATSRFRKLLENDPRSSWMYIKATTSTQATIRDSTYMSKYFGPKVEEAYAIRLSEIYLMKAEALVRSGGSITEAKTLLKTVMSKAGVADFTAIDSATTTGDMLIQLYFEYARNMVAEDGIEWAALTRLPLTTITQLRPTITKSEQLYFPIPYTEFQLNPTIGEQNPGYPRQVN